MAPDRGQRHGAVLAALIVLVALTPRVARADSPALTLAADVQNRLGVQTQALPAQKRAAQIDAFAKVLDPGPLAQLESDLLSAAASAAASKAEAERSRGLNLANGSVARKDVEAAEAQARNDAEHLDLLRRRLGLEWGPGIARLTDTQRKALIAQIAKGDAALVHVDTPSNEGQAGARTVDIDIGTESVHGRVLGAARAAEPRLQSSGLIVEVAGKSAVLLSVGLTQSAHINTTDAVTGVVLPREAVIRFQGSDWAYVRTDGARFERRLLKDPIAQDKGLFVAGGVKPGEPVIVRGAAEVFAVEQTQITRSR